MTLPAVIQRYIDAYNRKDVPAMLACLSEDVMFKNIAEGEVTVETTNKRAFADLAEIGVQAFECRHQDVLNAISVSDDTLIEVQFSAVVAADLPNGWTSGQNVSFRGASAFGVVDGEIVSIIDQSGTRS